MRNVGHRIALTLAVMTISAAALAQTATVRLTLKGGHFHPSEVTAPANRQVTIIVKNGDATPAEFESNTLRVEKIMTPGATVKLQIRPLAPGRYRFFNDFHQETDGYLVVK